MVNEGLLDEIVEVVGIEDFDDCERSFELKFDVQVINDDDDLKMIVEKMMCVWIKMCVGVNQLIQIYLVRVCGYCFEVYIGCRGYKL